MKKKLILGGARSGKSSYAEKQAIDIAKSESKELLYIATATNNDGEMRIRIKQHAQRRTEDWRLIEEPINLAIPIDKFNSDNYCILIDCLTLWLSNNLLSDSFPANKELFLNAFKRSQATILLVSNEVGSGVVPMGELSRQFVDESGWLHQELASICDEVALVVAGLPLLFKQ